MTEDEASLEMRPMLQSKAASREPNENGTRDITVCTAKNHKVKCQNT